MKKEAIYATLESSMLRYVDLIDVAVMPSGEKLVAISITSNLGVKPIDSYTLAYTGTDIYVRESIAPRLELASKLLASSNPRMQLQVVYGYRALSIQQKLFAKYKRQLKQQYSGVALLEAVHKMIAVPEIAGHPTGGAIDIQIVLDGQPLDFGTKIWEFSKDAFTFSPFVSQESVENRLLLRRILLEVGFAPFDGEWWHFSFGDKEWAKYYDKPNAIYEQIEFKKT